MKYHQINVVVIRNEQLFEQMSRVFLNPKIHQQVPTSQEARDIQFIAPRITS